MLFCKAIHKGMPRAKWPRQNFNLVNALLIHSWASVKPGIQLMDALFNYACFTFQNKKLLRCPSILPVGEQPEWMGRVMHRQNMKESCCISVVQKVSLANQTQECNSYNSVFNTLMSMDQDQLESRLHCHRAGIFTLDMPQTHYNYFLAKFGKLQSEVSIYNN